MQNLLSHPHFNGRSKLRILIVEDNEMDRMLIEREIKKSDLNFISAWADNRQDFLKIVNEFDPDVILCDYTMPHFGALEALTLLQDLHIQTPLIIITGTLTDKMAVACLEKGAADYVLKDKIIRLPLAVKMTLDLFWSRREKIDAEIHLRENQKKLKAITDVLPVLVGYISTDLRFQFCNKIQSDWFGSDITGKHVRDVLGQKVFDKIQGGLVHLNKGHSLQFESELPETSSGKVCFEITLMPDREGPAVVCGYACLISNITERKAYEKTLKIAKETADAANNAKSQFLANISHEMRTPLNAIMGLSEIIQSDHNLPDEPKMFIEKIACNAEHLKQVIDDVLDISKIESGEVQVEMMPFHIQELIAEVKTVVTTLAEEKKLEIKFNIVGSISEKIYSDPVKIKHILINIIGNAIKFSSTGPIEVNLESKPAQEPKQLKILVRDHGVGISKKQSTHLFEPFNQADNSMTRKFGGTGLGLAISKQFAQALGGDVKLLKSEIGQGSIFEITVNAGFFNRARRVSNLDSPLKAVSGETGPTINTKGTKVLNVLVVEDSIDNQFLIRRFLEKEGVQVDVASDGQEGLEKALNGTYDLVLMDIQMPVLDGYHATAQLREQGYTKPILAFTAHAFQAEKDRCLRGGFDDFLVKPIKKIELMNSINKFNNSTLH